MPVKKKNIPGKKIKKPQDKEWRKWYEGLDEKEHEAKLKQLGLEGDEIDEWEDMQEKGITLEELETATTAEGTPEKKSKKK